MLDILNQYGFDLIHLYLLHKLERDRVREGRWTRISITRVVEKYLEAIRSDVFVHYEKDFVQRIVLALSQGYRGSLHEQSLVQVVEDVVNSVNGLISRNNKTYLELSTRSIFVHGNKSQVEFDFYGEKRQRELCDLIFIISVVWNNRKVFEKLTLNQFKKDNKRYKRTIWDMRNREQLYLLSRFPSFRGVKGSLIPNKRYDLPNHSGCLGSYGLLYSPGDFAFVSATKLNSFIGNKKNLKIDDLYDLSVSEANHLCGHIPTILLQFHSILGNCHFCQDVFDFVGQYLRTNIGESVSMIFGTDNPQVKNFLHELMRAIENKAKMEGNQGMLDFTRAFYKFPYERGERRDRSDKNNEFDYESGGIGLIHTTVDLRE